MEKHQLRVSRVDKGNVSKAFRLWKDATKDPKRRFAGLDRPMNNPRQYLKANNQAKWMWLVEVSNFKFVVTLDINLTLTYYTLH